jgi:hypothetical protein
MQNVLSVADRLHRNPYPVTSIFRLGIAFLSGHFMAFMTAILLRYELAKEVCSKDRNDI